MSKVSIQMSEKEFKDYLSYKEKQLDIVNKIVSYILERIDFLGKDINKTEDYFRSCPRSEINELTRNSRWALMTYKSVLNKIDELRDK